MSSSHLHNFPFPQRCNEDVIMKATYSDIAVETRNHICLLAITTASASTLFFDDNITKRKVISERRRLVIESQSDRHPSEACKTALSLALLNHEHLSIVRELLEKARTSVDGELDDFILLNHKSLWGSVGFRLMRLDSGREFALRAYLSGKYKTCWTEKPVITRNRPATQLANLYETAAELEKLHHNLQGLMFSETGRIDVDRTSRGNCGPLRKVPRYTATPPMVYKRPSAKTKRSRRISGPRWVERLNHESHGKMHLPFSLMYLIQLLSTSVSQAQINSILRCWYHEMPGPVAELLKALLAMKDDELWQTLGST